MIYHTFKWLNILAVSMFFILDLVGKEASNLNENVGTLIVSYQTGPKAERLDRVRFWLKPQIGVAQIYPKGSESQALNESPSFTRTIVIENLSPGSYHLSFAIPNTDGLFEPVSPRTFTISKGETVKIDQQIKPRYARLKAKTNVKSGSFIPVISLIDANGIFIGSSNSGTLALSDLPPGNYHLVGDPLIGFKTPPPLSITLAPGQDSGPHLIEYPPDEEGQMALNEPTDLHQKQPLGVLIQNSWHYDQPSGEVYYPKTGQKVYTYSSSNQKSYGNLELNATVPSGERITITLTPLDKKQPIARPTLLSKDNKVIWQSPPLPVGKYTLSYQLPNYYVAVPDQVIELKRGQKLLLNPIFSAARSLTLKSNIDEAHYLLRSDKGNRVWKASGKTDVIKELLPGRYTLTFSSTDPHVFVSPPERKIIIGKFEDQTTEAIFKRAGRLLVTSNAEHYSISITSLQSDRSSKWHEILNKSEQFDLPEGNYRITFHALNGRDPERPGFNVPEPVLVTIHPFATEEISATYPSPSSSSQAFILIKSNTAQATYTIENADAVHLPQYRGKNTQIPLDAKKTYTITFGAVPNYKTPKTVEIQLKPGERRLIQVEYLPNNARIKVPKGPSILGDAFEENKDNELPPRKINLSEFSIDINAVTNAQYANWLNQAYKHGIIFYENKGENKGLVFDKEGRLLVRTYEATPTSQLVVDEDIFQGMSFGIAPGKENFPVIQVTWYGAVAYCRDNNCRLPSEAEWEKTAGMSPARLGEPLKKFRFGCGQDKIDRSWANYKINDSALTHFSVLTTPVGFYNGINKLPLLDYDEEQAVTHNALSPYGAYDMSGNVWEWVLDWYANSYPEDFANQDPAGPANGSQKVAKGGCYDSLADGVRVAERIGLPLDYADAFTGFRTVKGKPLLHHSWFEKEKKKFLNL